MSRKKAPTLDPDKYRPGLVLGRTRCPATLTCGKPARVMVSQSGNAYLVCPHCDDQLNQCSTKTFFGQPETLAWAAAYDRENGQGDKPKKKGKVKDDRPTDRDEESEYIF